MSDLRITITPERTVYGESNRIPCSTNFHGQVSASSQDTLELSEKKKKKLNFKKIFLIGLVLKIVTGVVGLKLYKANYIKRAQKTFQKVFMRDSISKDETVKMLQRYKEITKIKDKDEYIKALFDETKKNFGLENGCLELKTFTSQEHPNIGGFVNKGKPYININKDRKPHEIMDTMHHEMKHKQQEYMMMNYCGDFEEYICRISPVKDMTKGDLSVEFLETMRKENPKWLEQFNLKELDKKNVPEKYKDYVENLLKDSKTYVEGIGDNGTVNKEYLNNFIEQDARTAGSKISKLLRWFIPI